VLPPGFQVYVRAPLAVKVDELPAQMVAGLAVAITVGIGLTTKVTVCVPGQAKVLVPVIEYVVVIVGFTTIEEVMAPPGFQV
jgi:hypothetical protein